MDYNDLSENMKTKMYDLYVKNTCSSVHQEQFRYFIGRDFWLVHDKEVDYYYKEVNKLSRKEKIQKIKDGLRGD